MKKVIALIAVLAVARENPFVLPQSSSTSAPQKSISLTTQPKSHAELKTAEKNISTSSSNIKQPVAQTQGQKLADFGFLQLLIQNDTLVLATKDRLRRTFTIDKPKKVVFDFSKRRHFASKTIVLNKGAFKKVSIGAHKSFYRVAIEVSRSCKPKINALSLMCQ